MDGQEREDPGGVRLSGRPCPLIYHLSSPSPPALSSSWCISIYPIHIHDSHDPRKFLAITRGLPCIPHQTVPSSVCVSARLSCSHSPATGIGVGKCTPLALVVYGYNFLSTSFLTRVARSAIPGSTPYRTSSTSPSQSRRRHARLTLYRVASGISASLAASSMPPCLLSTP